MRYPILNSSLKPVNEVAIVPENETDQALAALKEREKASYERTKLALSNLKDKERAQKLDRKKAIKDEKAKERYEASRKEKNLEKILDYKG